MIAGTCSGITRHNNNAASHTVFISATSRADKISGITVNLYLTAFHFTAGVNKSVSGYFNISTSHKLPEISTGITFDGNPPLTHGMTNMIQFG